MNGKALALGVVGAALAYVVLGESDAEAKVPDPAVDCHSDAECLGKRGIVKVTSKVTTVLDAARVTSAASSPTGRAWVDDQRDQGLEVVTPDKNLVEGATLLATTPEDAKKLVEGGLFRRVD